MNRRDCLKYVSSLFLTSIVPLGGIWANQFPYARNRVDYFPVSTQCRHGLLVPYDSTPKSNVFFRMDRLQSRGFINSDEDLWVWFFVIEDKRGTITFDRHGNLLCKDLPENIRLHTHFLDRDITLFDAQLIVKSDEEQCTFIWPRSNSKVITNIYLTIS